MTDTVVLDAAAQATADAAAKIAADKVAADTAAASTAASDQAAAAATEKAAADKVIADTAAAEKAARDAIVYDLKAPEGITLDAALVERTVAIARAQGLSPAAAQEVLTATAKELQAQEATRLAEWEPVKGVKWIAYNADLKKQALADPEVGGSEEKLKNSAELAQMAIRTLADGDAKFETQIKDFLTTSGLASHPIALRIFSRIGRRMNESSLILAPSSATPGKKSMKESMYPGDGTGPKPTTSTE